jgi:hypothetical protein
VYMLGLANNIMKLVPTVVLRLSGCYPQRRRCLATSKSFCR